MNRFSLRSRTRLNTCHPDLVRLFETVLQKQDCMVLEGVRTPERQEALLRAGRSRTRNSRHLPGPDGLSRAADVVPYPIPDWSDTAAFVAFGVLVVETARELGIPLRWGGDWDGDGDRSDQTFDDLVHFELRDREPEHTLFPGRKVTLRLDKARLA